MRREGFTLIELAIALTIIGLVIGGSFQAIKAMRERNKIVEAKDMVKSAKDALIGDANTYGDLSTLANFDQNLSPARAITVGSLIKKSLFYFPANSLVNPQVNICTQITTDLEIEDKKSTPARIIPNIAFVLAHESANANIQTTLNSSVTPQRVTIYAPHKEVDDNTAAPNINRTSDEYDDIIEWVTLSELKEAIGCQRPRILNTSLPDDTNNSSSYHAMIYFDGNSTPPSTGGCTPQSPYNTEYNSTSTVNFEIKENVPNRTPGVAKIVCGYKVDGYDINKSFTITIHAR